MLEAFFCRNYNKVFMETGKFSGNPQAEGTGNGLVSGVDRALKSCNSACQKIGDRLNPLGKSVEFDILFLDQPSGILLTRVHDDIKILVQWKWKVSCVSVPCAKDISVFGYRRYWDHLSLYGHIRLIKYLYTLINPQNNTDVIPRKCTPCWFDTIFCSNYFKKNIDTSIHIFKHKFMFYLIIPFISICG